MADDPTHEPDPADPELDELDEQGRAALARANEEAKTRRLEVKAEKARAEAAEAEVARLKAAGASDVEQATAQAKAETRAEVLQSANERVVRAEIRAAAAGKLSDPADAFAFIPVDHFSVGDDGEVDGEAITKAVDDLVASKPYLASSTTPPPLPGGGSRATSGAGSINDIIREAAGLG